MNFFKKIIYRIWQFKQTLFPIINNELWNEAKSKLPAKWQPHFERLRASERAHVLRVYKEAKSVKNLTTKDFNRLIKLALVHDIGKGITRHSIWFKVAKVLLPISNRAHCIEGAKLLKRLGAEKELIIQVLRHHEKSTNDQLLILLQRIDDKS